MEGVAGFQGCWKAGALHNLTLKVCSVWTRLSFEDDWIGSSKFSSAPTIFCPLSFAPSSWLYPSLGKWGNNNKLQILSWRIVSGVLYPNSQLANPSPIQRKSTLKTESAEMWTFLGKYISSSFFLFSSFIWELKFSGFVIWFRASVTLFFGNNHQCRWSRIDCREMPATVLTGTRLSFRQTGKMRRKLVYGFVVWERVQWVPTSVLSLFFLSSLPL